MSIDLRPTLTSVPSGEGLSLPSTQAVTVDADDLVTVVRWDGRKAVALRLALRSTVEAFAQQLGVGPRTIAKWASRGESIEPSPICQAILDTALRRADESERARFVFFCQGITPVVLIKQSQIDRLLSGADVDTAPIQVDQTRADRLSGGQPHTTDQGRASRAELRHLE